MPPQDAPAVRFASSVQEITPTVTTTSPTDTQSPTDAATGASLPEVTPEELRALSKSLQSAPLQQRRMNVFGFEPYSLPASRVRYPSRLLMLVLGDLSTGLLAFCLGVLLGLRFKVYFYPSTLSLSNTASMSRPLSQTPCLPPTTIWARSGWSFCWEAPLISQSHAHPRCPRLAMPAQLLHCLARTSLHNLLCC